MILAALDVAVPAIYRLVAARLERYFSLLAALRAGRRIHLPGSSAHAAIVSKTLGSPILPTCRAALGFIGIAFGSKEFLLLNGKRESIAAIGTLE